MRTFDYSNTPDKLLTPQIIKLVAKIHEHKGKQDLFLHSRKDELTSLIEVANIQSTGASNRIEGIHTTDKRLKELVLNNTEPKNRSEQEIVGYKDVLNTIHENYDYISLTPNVILQLHRDLYAYEGSNVGGKFKNVDNIITETDSHGNNKIRFQPLPAFLTDTAINSLCDSFNAEIEKNIYDELLIIPMFILDFLCIHPFNDGNGRISRLLTLLLLYKANYIVGKYISLEALIEKTKDSYYEALQQSSINWENETNDYVPFVKYCLGILLNAYLEFEDRIEYLNEKGISKSERIKKTIDNKLGQITKKEIMTVNPDISKITVERALTELVKSGYIKKVGAGPSTAYIKSS